MKAFVFKYLQPATLVAIVAFWGLAPKTVVDSPWSLTIASGLTMALAQALEWFNERHAGWRLNRQEFATDLFYVILSNTVIATATTTLTDDPLHALKVSWHIATPWVTHLPYVVQVALILFLVEFGQYWMHRGMHNWTPLWLTHAPHHHITQLNALKGAVGNPIELFLISLSVIALFDFSPVAVFAAAHLGVAIGCFAHANIRFDPPRWYAFFFTTIEHHSLHHSTDYESTRCNYANCLILIDRFMGTFKPGEADLVGQDERRRLSIREQWIFPFVPVIRFVRARRSGVAAA